MKRVCLIFLMILMGPPLWAQFEVIISELDQTSSHIDGPNCWNGALYTAGVLDSKRFIHPDEWLYHLRANCHEVLTPKPGDIGRLYYRDPQGRVSEVHGFIHLNDELIFAKHGESSQHGYQLMSYQKMMEQYGRTRECRMVGESRPNDPTCDHQLAYYSCHNKGHLPSPWPKIHSLLESFLFSEETQWQYREKCDGDIFKRREQILLEMSDLLKAHTLENSANSELLRLISASFSHQLYNIQVAQRNFRCRDRKLRDHAQKVLKSALKAYQEAL